MSSTVKLGPGGWTAQVTHPFTGSSIDSPWVSMNLGDGCPVWGIKASRLTANGLRKLADDLDVAWAEMDRQEERHG